MKRASRRGSHSGREMNGKRGALPAQVVESGYGREDRVEQPLVVQGRSPRREHQPMRCVGPKSQNSEAESNAMRGGARSGDIADAAHDR